MKKYISVPVLYLPRLKHPRNESLHQPMARLISKITSVTRKTSFKPKEVPLTEEELLKLEKGHREEIYRSTSSVFTQIEKSKERKSTSTKGKIKIQYIKPDRNPQLLEPITPENQYQQLAERVTPLCEVPYMKQLSIKGHHMNNVLRVLGRRLRDVRAPMEATIKGLPCPLEPVRPSPELISYRNKDEFGMNYGVDKNPKTLGFYVGRPSDPLMACVPPTFLINMRQTHKDICKSFQNFIRSSPHKACIKFGDGGIWRDLIVRSTQGGEKMGVVVIHPQHLTEVEILEIMEDLRRYFFEGEGVECQLDSLYLQTCQHTRCTREQSPFRLIAGKEYITETCLGLSFQISPDAFFQINTKGAGVLYDTVREIAEVSPITTLLDVCCGTGSISMMMAPYVRGTVGIDVASGAVQDARRNATLNNLTNTQFFIGKAEKVLPNLARDLNDCSDVVAIVNPARGGLHPDVIRTIRQCQAITKLIFISCKPEGFAMENFVKLGSTKGIASQKDKSPPFVPKYAVPVDMFPHTDHTELVVLFERVDS